MAAESATLAFTASDLAARGARSPSGEVLPYSGVEDFVALSAWPLRPSLAVPEAVALQLSVPPDLDATASIRVDLSVLIRAETGVSAAARFRIRADARSSGDLLGPGFDQTASSSDIGVVEPPPATRPGARYVRVPVTLSCSGMLPGDSLVLAVDRIAPEGAEYPADLFLAGLTLTYRRR